MVDEPSRDEDRDPADESAPFQDKTDPDARPDQPTPSEDATLVERGEGAHAEFLDAPTSIEDADDRDRSQRSGDTSQSETTRS